MQQCTACFVAVEEERVVKFRPPFQRGFGVLKEKHRKRDHGMLGFATVACGRVQRPYECRKLVRSGNIYSRTQILSLKCPSPRKRNFGVSLSNEPPDFSSLFSELVLKKSRNGAARSGTFEITRFAGVSNAVMDEKTSTSDLGEQTMFGLAET